MEAFDEAELFSEAVRAAAERAEAAEAAHSARTVSAAAESRRAAESAAWRVELSRRELLEAEMRELEVAYAACYDALCAEREARERIAQRAMDISGLWALRARSFGESDVGEPQLDTENKARLREEEWHKMADYADEAASALQDFSDFAHSGALGPVPDARPSVSSAESRGMREAAKKRVEVVEHVMRAAAAAKNSDLYHAARNRLEEAQYDADYVVSRCGGAAESAALAAARARADDWEARARALQASVDELELELASRPNAREFADAIKRAQRAEAALAEERRAVSQLLEGHRSTDRWEADRRREPVSPCETRSALSARDAIRRDKHAWYTTGAHAQPPHGIERPARPDCSVAARSRGNYCGPGRGGPAPPERELLERLCDALGVVSPAYLGVAVDEMQATAASWPRLQAFVQSVLGILRSAPTTDGDDPTASPALALAELSRWAAERPEITRLQAYVADDLREALLSAPTGVRELVPPQASGGAIPKDWRRHAAWTGSAPMPQTPHTLRPVRWLRGGTAGSRGANRDLEAKAARVQASLIEWLASDL